MLGAFSYFGLILRDRDNFSFAAIGLIVSLYGAASIVAARYLGFMAGRLGERRLILFGGTLITLAILGMTAPPIPFFLFAMVLGGFGFITMHTTFQTRATELSPSARATGVSMFAFSLFLGGSIGSFAVAQSFEIFGFDPTLYGLAIVTMSFVLVAAVFILTLTQPHGVEDEGLAPDRRAGGDAAGALPE